MPKILDKEFGEIIIRRNGLTKNLRISISPNGSVRVSSPSILPVAIVKQYVNASRGKIRQLLSYSSSEHAYEDGERIGKEHAVHVKHGSMLDVSRHGKIITVSLPPSHDLIDDHVQNILRKEVGEALRLEAKKYLPRRLQVLSDTMNVSYAKVRLSHASSRWGSCSSSGTISLNIALMKLSYELIDYVIVHELAHVSHMNHSKFFWQEVGKYDPKFKQHRAALKKHTPSI
jgi:predicted metal-dependent hydrolase